MPRGFTLIELLVVVAIAGVLAVLALPSMRDLVLTNRMKTLSLDIYSSLVLARSEAVKRNAGNISMVQAPGGWQNGWTVCVDANSNSACDSGEEVLIVGEAVDSSVTVTTSPTVTIFTYGRDGRLTSTVSEFRITATGRPDDLQVLMRCVQLSASGRPNTRADTNHTDSDGC
jgi:type IV fimbrial biogenesis protein FimT